jgi:L-2-hydroxyglutarate oxidase LhgO
MINLAANLASGLGSKNNYIWGKSGIRAQLINIDKMKLENDFVCLPGKQSMHVLNAVSPGFTCALPFSSYVVDQVEKQINIQN